MRTAALLALGCLPLLQAQTVSFSKTVYPVLEKAACASCHNVNGVASATRLHFPEADAPASRIDAFGNSLVTLVDRIHPEESVIFKKPTKRMPHTGGERIKPGSPEDAIWLSWIQHLSTLAGADLAEGLSYGQTMSAGARKAIPSPVLRKLTNSQYNNTVRDLLGDLSAPASQFPPEDFVNGFTNQYEAQNFSPMLAEAYNHAAGQLAAVAFRHGDEHHLIPCKPSVACRAEFVRSFGQKAFRRPLDASEVGRYQLLFARDGDFMKGAQLVVEAMLMSPKFLFRLDATPSAALRPYATASRLSYALWDTMPDDGLLDAAKRGELSTADGVAKVSRKMLQDPRAHQALDEFVAQWLRFDRVLTTVRDRRRYSEFNRETAIAMTEEAKLFISELVWNNRNFMEAYTADYGFANSELAAIYGIPAPAKEFDKVTFLPQSERSGLLGQTLFLTLTSKPDDTSITARGLFVRNQFLCQSVPPPLPGVDTNLPESTEANPKTNRQRMLAHESNPVCASCHSLVDPIGWGFEKFDAIGKRREKYVLTFGGGRGGGGGGRRGGGKSVSLDMDTLGQVAGIPESSFSSPKELGVILARTPQCQECVIKQYFRYLAGRQESPADQPMIDRVMDDFRKSGFHFQDMMVSLIGSREFPNTQRSEHVASNHQAR
jgi:hypothetical protein